MAGHCLPNGLLGTGELAVPNFPGPGPTLVPPSPLKKRGVVVYSHGLGTGSGNYPEGVLSAGPENDLANALVADGWIVIRTTELGDTGGLPQNTNWFNDFSNDRGQGSRLNANNLHLLDHIIEYCNLTYPGYPIFPMGISLGGYYTLLFASQRASAIAGFVCMCPATQLWTIQGIVSSWNQAPVVTFNLDSSMNGLTLPQSTIKVQTGISGIATSGCIVVQASGGTGAQVIRYNGISGQTFLGTTGGNTALGTMATGGTVTQSSFTTGADILMTALNNLPKGTQGVPPPGFIQWGSFDFIVGYPNTVVLGQNAAASGSPVTTQANHITQHGIDDTDVTTIMTWITANVDPKCPPIFF